MMLRLILGTAGAGKSAYVSKISRERAEKGEKTIYIVPEQNSFDTEREMLFSLSAHVAERVQVFSFTRLAGVLCSGRSRGAGKRLDECGKAAVMSMALAECQESLEMYAKRNEDVSLVSHMLDAVKEFKLCAISPDDLTRAAGEAQEPVLRMKLGELSLVYRTYDTIVGSTALDPLDDLTRLARTLADERPLAGQTVVIDSFRGFTGQELRVIAELLSQCKEVYITLYTDNYSDNEGGMGLFSPVRRTARRLLSEAKQRGVETAAPVTLTAGARFRSEALKALEQGLFRYEGAAWEPEAKEITVYAAQDMRDEASFTARECRRLAREEGYRYREIAVIARSEADYAAYLSQAMDKQEVRCFIDRRVAVEYSPLIRYLDTALELLGTQRQTEDMLRLLKTRMIADVTLEETMLIEDYCLVWDIPARRWSEPFTENPRGLSAEMTEEDSARLAAVNRVRERLWTLLEGLAHDAQKSTGEGLSAASYYFLERSGSAEAVRELCNELTQDEGEVQGKIWDMLMEMLDQLAEIIGEKEIKLSEYLQLLRMMASTATVGVIPQSLDEVTFGSAERTRPYQPRAVFILGAAEGVFPAKAGSSGVFTDSERKALIACDLPVAEPAEQTLLEERLLAYSAMLCASERLYVTYPASDFGEQRVPSELVSEVLRLVPGCRRPEKGDSIELWQIEGEEAAFELAAARLRDRGSTAAALISTLRRRESMRGRLEAIEQAGRAKEYRLTDSALAKKLFGRQLRISPSSAEKYYSCPFAYFCRYGMKAKPRQKAQLDRRQYGKAVHFVLEQVCREYGALGIIALREQDKLRETVDKALESYLDGQMGGENRSARFASLMRRFAAGITEQLKNLAEEFTVSSFRPVDYELNIGDEVKPLRLKLSDGREITVGGIVDRVDACMVGAEKYIRIIDYKTGAKSFSIGEALGGLNLQMPIYLDILCSSGRYGSCSPAGILYMPSNAETKALGRYPEQSDADKKRRSALKMNGVLLENRDVLKAMERDMAGEFVPVATVKTGELKKSSSVLNEHVFGLLLRHVRELLRQMGESLAQGRIEANPACGEVSACERCEYSAVCGFEQPENGREIVKVSLDEAGGVLERLYGTEEKDG